MGGGGNRKSDIAIKKARHTNKYTNQDTRTHVCPYESSSSESFNAQTVHTHQLAEKLYILLSPSGHTKRHSNNDCLMASHFTIRIFHFVKLAFVFLLLTLFLFLLL